MKEEYLFDRDMRKRML